MLALTSAEIPRRLEGLAYAGARQMPGNQDFLLAKNRLQYMESVFHYKNTFSLSSIDPLFARFAWNENAFSRTCGV